MTTTTLPITCIVAADRNDGIALDDVLPWHLPHDLARFKRLTIGDGHCAVVMGRSTWDTLPAAFQPLPRRKNIVLTRGQQTFAGALRANDWPAVLALADGCSHLWVVGGAQIYALALSQPETTAIELTRIDHDFGCNTIWCGVPATFVLEQSEPRHQGELAFTYERWVRRAAT